MTRKVITYTVPGTRVDQPGSRDNGKSFVITEMPADQGEEWTLGVLRSLMSSGVQIPQNVIDAGAAGLAGFGYDAIFAFIPSALRAELLSTVQYQQAPNMPLQAIMAGINSQIEEKSTRVALGRAAFELNLGFSDTASTQTAAQDRAQTAA